VAPRTILDAEEIARALRRIAGEISERTKGASSVALVGVRRGGVPLADRLRTLLHDAEGLEVPVGSVDITLNRDDASTALPNPQIGRSDLTFALEGRTVILVDDVLFTGRTTRAAIDALLDYGRPKAIQLAVLVDRGHRELPIQPDYVGRVVSTARTDRVDVSVGEAGARDEVVIA
jgi:pyrimidine operon attenuation protein/uracil phosphoribosyltransferase